MFEKSCLKNFEGNVGRQNFCAQVTQCGPNWPKQSKVVWIAQSGPKILSFKIALKNLWANFLRTPCICLQSNRMLDSQCDLNLYHCPCIPCHHCLNVLLFLLFLTPVRLEADGEENEGHVRRRDREPRDQLVLEHRHPATQKCLHF